MEENFSLSSLIKNVYDSESYTDAFLFLIEQIEKVNLEVEKLQLELDRMMGEIINSTKVSDSKMDYVLAANPEAYKLKKSLIEFVTLKKSLYYYTELLEGRKQFLLKEKEYGK